MPMISEHVKMLILFGSFCNDRYCLFLVIIEIRQLIGTRSPISKLVFPLPANCPALEVRREIRILFVNPLFR